MKWTIIFIAFLGLTACKNQTDKKGSVSDNREVLQKEYSEKVLIEFLDSIGKLNPQKWTKELSFIVDSTLYNQTKLNHTISPTDFEELKKASKSKKISFELAKKIFPNIHLEDYEPDYPEENKIHINLYSFDDKVEDFKHYAISIGWDEGMTWSNLVYFFNNKKVISRHNIFHRYGLELKHFKNESNETVIYYKVNNGSGTGIWWHQFNFYLYDKEELKPTLTEIKNINLQFPWSIRTFWIESTILDTKPLTLKFVFNNQFTDTLGNQIEFINDSTEVKYNFDRNKKTHEPEFSDNKINKLKLLTYFLADNELLFVNVNYELFKKELNGNDEVKKQAIFKYLNALKNGPNKQ
jgi:hypothetical protein